MAGVGSNSSPDLPYAVEVMSPPDSPDWVGLFDDELPIVPAMTWAVLPSCGALVTFTGHARDHSPGRSEVHSLEYEAYETEVGAKLADVAVDMRKRWPAIGRIALLHRSGQLEIGDAAVVVAVSTPHRVEAFEAARFGIDTLKERVPIWKREVWSGGSSWVAEPQHCGESA